MHAAWLQEENHVVTMQVIALAERGTLYDPGPCMYMEKIAVGPGVDPSAVSLNNTVKENLMAVSKALRKPLAYAFHHIYIVLMFEASQSWPLHTRPRPAQSVMCSWMV